MITKYFLYVFFLITHYVGGPTSYIFVIIPQVVSVTGVKIVNYCSPLYFANAEIFRQRVIKKVQ